MEFHFNKDTLSDFAANIHREWAITNGIGGYAGSSVLGAHNRTHQGYLIASYHPPVERYMVFSKTNETVKQADTTWDLTTGQYAGEPISHTVVSGEDVPEEYKRSDTVNVESDFVPRRPVYRTGNQFLADFCYDGNVHFTYQVGELTIQKTIFMVRGHNKTVILYDVDNAGSAATLSVTPLFNFRDHSGSSTPETLQFDTQKIESEDPRKLNGVLLYPKNQPDEYFIWLSGSPCDIRDNDSLYDVDMQFQTEVDNEVSGLDCNYTPYQLCFSIPAHGSCRHAIICETGKKEELAADLGNLERDVLAHADLYYAESVKYYNHLLEKAEYSDDDFANTLVLASNQFLAKRQSTGLMTVLAGLPWFTDWGRDTMIAFTGLTLCTKRFQEAADILKTFSMYVHHGMVPNMFPDNGAEPMYNTVDASLWYFYAVERFLTYTGTEEAKRYIQRSIYPALKEIIAAYKDGTDFSIYMDRDYLIHAGSGTDQVTWMDVRVGDWVVTPRHGKPVEISALWYNALRVMEDLATQFGDGNDAKMYGELAQHVKESFCREFWYEEGGYLYDVVDGEEKDSSLRPNQIYAVSLPYTMLSEEQAASVVKVVQDQLVAGPGIRSLAPSHKDYHPIYLGSLPKRDAAYHQGTAWGFLMGGFLSAYMKVNHHSPEAAQKAMDFLEPVKEHLTENCVGSICEIFDGDAPHLGRGCYAQAWSVGEVLRSYTEDIKPYLK